MSRQLLICERPGCSKKFLRLPGNISPHNYCSRSCAVTVNNHKFPKNPAPQHICLHSSCNKNFRGPKEQIFCSLSCRIASQQKFTPAELTGLIKSKYITLGRVPAKRDVGPISDMCIRSFGSWNQTLILAGFTPHRSHSERMYKRRRVIASDGHHCDSASEAIIDDWLSGHGVSHERNVSYPTTGHKSDWALPDRKIFLEYFGLAKDSSRYDVTVAEKKKLCQKHGIELISIVPQDLYPNNCLDEVLVNLL